MPLMQGKKGLVFGVANDRSYAWYISKQLIEQGATCAFTHLPDPKGKMERRCRSAITELGVTDPWLAPCDASKDEDLDAVFDKFKADHGKLDFVVHSIAYADREFLKLGNFHTTTRQAWSATFKETICSPARQHMLFCCEQFKSGDVSETVSPSCSGI